jgi:hypothetical protein
LGPVGTAGTNRPIVLSAPSDYDDGEIGGMIGRGNRSTRGKPAPVPLCPPQTPTWCPDANPGRRSWKSATNRLSYGTASIQVILVIFLSLLVLHIYVPQSSTSTSWVHIWAQRPFMLIRGLLGFP